VSGGSEQAAVRRHGFAILPYDGAPHGGKWPAPLDIAMAVAARLQSPCNDDMDVRWTALTAANVSGSCVRYCTEAARSGPPACAHHSVLSTPALSTAIRNFHMFSRARLAISATLLALGISPAAAFTPESGIWWNPAESGTGLQIEIQDNFMALSGYVFNDDGTPVWVTAQGLLQAGGTRFVSSDNRNDGSWLNTFSGGQCIGCPYAGPPTAQLGSKGPLVVTFDPSDPTIAVLNWGGRNILIERFQFNLGRPGDNVLVHTSKMLGEWNAMLDLSNATTPAATNFVGDVVVFDRINPAIAPQRATFEGCRPADAVTTHCTTTAATQNDVAGSFDVETRRHVFVVTETRDSAGDPLTCLLYDVRVDTNSFEGGLDGDLQSSNDGGVIPYPCGTGNVFVLPAYPVRGFRSASRTEVEAASSAPANSSAAIDFAMQAAKLGVPAPAGNTWSPGNDSADVQVRRNALVTQLEQQLFARRLSAD